jgi:hypothetical protein
MSRLYSQLTGGGEVVSLLCQLPFTFQEDSWYFLLLECEPNPGYHGAAEKISSTEKSSDLIGNRTHDHHSRKPLQNISRLKKN